MTGPSTATNTNEHPRVVIDVAGAAIGGSGRFLAELDAYLSAADTSQTVRIIGRNRRLTPLWLIQRERLARRAEIRIALNNASFVSPGGKNIVLLRNVLHFGSRREFKRHSFSPSMGLRAQIPAIRATATRAHRVVVPTSAMAERVARRLPCVESAIRVRAHPVAQRPWAGKRGTLEVGILVPIVPAPYKHLDRHVGALLRSTEGLKPLSVRITVTATAEELPLVADHPRLNLIGRLPANLLDRYWEKSLAVYYPTSLEAFGYPLAESRVNGRYVIGQDTDQNQEVAGNALCPFVLGDERSLTSAARDAISGMPSADPMGNELMSYFDWLFEGAEIL